MALLHDKSWSFLPTLTDDAPVHAWRSFDPLLVCEFPRESFAPTGALVQQGNESLICTQVTLRLEPSHCLPSPNATPTPTLPRSTVPPLPPLPRPLF